MHPFIDDLVSIVIPVYNCEKFIEETIESVRRQTYPNWELILVDDCSKDQSASLMQKKAESDERIRVVLQEINRGAAASRNAGVDLARGRYLCYLDSDDLWLPEKLEKELDFIREKQAGFVFMGYEFANEHGVGLGKIVQVPETITYRQALGNTTIFTSTVMMDRSVIASDDCKMPGIASEDTATWWSILKKYGKGYGLNLNLVRYRRSENTLSSNKLVAMKRIWNLYRKQENLSVWASARYFVLWAFRAVFRRI